MTTDAPSPPAAGGAPAAAAPARVVAVVALALSGMLLLPALLLPAAPPTLGRLLAAAALTSGWLALVALVATAGPPRARAADLGLVRPRVRGAAWWAVAIAGGLAVSEAMDFAIRLSGAGRGAALDLLLGLLGGARGAALAGALLVVAAGAGFAEELFFRGWVQRRLVARAGPVGGIVVAAALFALAHFDLRHSAYAFVFGAFTGAVARWSGSTWPAIAVHAANNAVAIALLVSGTGDPGAALPRGGLAVACLASFAVAVACAAWLFRHRAGLDAGDGARVGSGA